MTAHAQRLLLAALLLLPATGCVDPELPEGGWFSCSDEHPECPAGHSCIAGRCVKDGTDGPLPDIAGMDAGADAAQDLVTDQLVADAPVPDGPAPDLQPDGPAPDLAPAPDQLVPDGPVPDLVPTPDLALPDLQPTPDLAVPDLQPTPDLALPADLPLLPDTAPPTDGGPGPLTLLDPGGLALETSAGGEGFADVAWGGGVYLAVWQRSDNDIYGMLVNPTGAVSTSPFAIATGTAAQQSPAVSFDGTQFFVVWVEAFNHIRGKHVSTAGVVGTTTIDVSAPSVYTKESPVVAFNGSNHLVAWADTRNNPTSGVDVYAAVVTKTGTVLTGTDIAVATGPGAQDQLGIASLGSGFLLVWDDQGTSPWHVNGKTVTGAGVVGTSELTLDHATDNVRFADVASDGTHYLVVYRLGTAKVMATRVNATGTAIDVPPVLVRVGSTGIVHPAAAWNGSHYLAVWSEGGDLLGTRLTSGVVPVDSPPVIVSNAANTQSFVQVAGGPVHFMAVWLDMRNTAVSSMDVYGARLQ